MLTYVHLGKAFAPYHDLFFYTSGTFVVSTIFEMSAERSDDISTLVRTMVKKWAVPPRSELGNFWATFGLYFTFNGGLEVLLRPLTRLLLECCFGYGLRDRSCLPPAATSSVRLGALALAELLLSKTCFLHFDSRQIHPTYTLTSRSAPKTHTINRPLDPTHIHQRNPPNHRSREPTSRENDMAQPARTSTNPPPPPARVRPKRLFPTTTEIKIDATALLLIIWQIPTIAYRLLSNPFSHNIYWLIVASISIPKVTIDKMPAVHDNESLCSITGSAVGFWCVWPRLNAENPWVMLVGWLVLIGVYGVLVAPWVYSVLGYLLRH